MNQVSNSSFDFNSNDNNDVLGISTMNLNMISNKIKNVIGGMDFGKRKIKNKSSKKNNQCGGECGPVAKISHGSRMVFLFFLFSF